MLTTSVVRGPLNGIIIGLEEAIASAIDEETRQNVKLSYSASLTLTRVINELLVSHLSIQVIRHR